MRSVADGILLRFKSRAFKLLSDRSGIESLLGRVFVPARFPKREVPRAGKARPHRLPVLALFWPPMFLQPPVPQPPGGRPKLNPHLLLPERESCFGFDVQVSSSCSKSTFTSSSTECLRDLSTVFLVHSLQIKDLCKYSTLLPRSSSRRRCCAGDRQWQGVSTKVTLDRVELDKLELEEVQEERGTFTLFGFVILSIVL